MTSKMGNAVPIASVAPGGEYRDTYVSIVLAEHLDMYLATTREKPHCWLHVEEPRLHQEGARFLLGVGEWLWWFEVVRVMCDEPFEPAHLFGFGPGTDRPEMRDGVPVMRRKVLFSRGIKTHD